MPDVCFEPIVQDAALRRMTVMRTKADLQYLVCCRDECLQSIL